MPRYFDDASVGDTFESLGTFHVTRDAILDFAREWDPQTYHVDEQAAKASFAGGLSASGVHTLAITMRLAHQSGFFNILPIAGLGIDGFRLLKPVLPGDYLRVRITITALRPSKSRPDRGVITNLTELINQADEIVLRFSLSELVSKEAHAPASP